jgi:uncharacterized protein YjcR
MWLERVSAPAIAKELGIKVSMVWRWRYRYNWPARIPLGAENANLVRMAAKAWADDMPRIEIALLCDISLGTLDTWRKRYGWEKRKPGLRPGTGTGLRALERDRVGRLRARLAKPKEAILRFRKSLPRWRCCGYLLESTTCPECKRRSPACA